MDLKPCPICGNEPELHYLEDHLVFIGCPTVYLRPDGDFSCPASAETPDQWNYQWELSRQTHKESDRKTAREAARKMAKFSDFVPTPPEPYRGKVRLVADGKATRMQQWNGFNWVFVEVVREGDGTMDGGAYGMGSEKA